MLHAFDVHPTTHSHLHIKLMSQLAHRPADNDAYDLLQDVLSAAADVLCALPPGLPALAACMPVGVWVGWWVGEWMRAG